MYNLLNEYADEMYGAEFDKKGSDADSDDSSEEEDMEKAMAKETSALKQVNSKERRFQNTMTKTKNVVFIRTTLDDPDRLVHEIFRDGLEKQVKKTRYAQRILPVKVICKTDLKSLEAGLTEVLKPYFATEFGVGLKYTAQCKIRYNNSVARTVILTSLGKIVKEMNPLHTLCHDEPDLVIIIEVVMQVCCLSVVKDFFKFRRYNYEQIFNLVGDSGSIETGVPNTGDSVVDEQTIKTEETGIIEVESMKENIDKESKTDEVKVSCTEMEVKENSDEIKAEISDVIDKKDKTDKSNSVEEIKPETKEI